MPPLPSALHLETDRRGVRAEGLMIRAQLGPKELPLVIKIHQLPALPNPYHGKQSPAEERRVDANERIDDCAMRLAEAKESAAIAG